MPVSYVLSRGARPSQVLELLSCSTKVRSASRLPSTSTRSGHLDFNTFYFAHLRLRLPRHGPSADPKLARKHFESVHLYIPGITRCWDLYDTFFGLCASQSIDPFLTPFRPFFMNSATRRRAFQLSHHPLSLFSDYRATSREAKARQECCRPSVHTAEALHPSP
jgi:hypothetical protein